MAFTYSGDPRTSDRDAVRLWIQDTDRDFPLLQDEEIDYLIETMLGASGHVLGVAATCCEVIAARFAREINTSADGVSVALGDLQTKYNELARSLRDQLHTLPSTNAVLETALDLDVDPTIRPLAFGVGFMDFLEAGLQDYGYYSPGHYYRELAP